MARLLQYELVSLSYGDLKLEKWKNFKKKIVSHLQACERVFSGAAKNGTIFSRN